MGGKELLLGIFTILFLTSATMLILATTLSPTWWKTLSFETMIH